MFTNYLLQRYFLLKLISRLESDSVVFRRSFKMSGGPNPLNGSLPPDWNRFPSMNTYQQTQCYNMNPFPNISNRRAANAFGYNPNQQHTSYTQPQYILPATHMWNNHIQYQQNSLYQPNSMQSSQTFSNMYPAVPIQQQSTNFGDFMSTTYPPAVQDSLNQNYPTLSDRLALLESQIAYNYGQPNSDNFGSALNSFVQDMMFVTPPLTNYSTLPLIPPLPITTLYQSNLLKDLLVTNNISSIPEVSEAAIQTGQFDLSTFLTPSEERLLKFESKLDLSLSEEKMAIGDYISKQKCSLHRLHRHWQTIRSPSNSDRSFHFSILNYNVLAQDLLEMHPELYYRHDEGALNWNVRWNNLKEEFQKYNCDIICLQEVQDSHKDLFDSNFKSLGYSGLYKKRTGSKTDGCSIYFRENMFKLLEFITVEYNQPRVNILDRDNIAIIAKFLAKGNDQEIVIANTHLLFNPRRQDIRLVQTQLLLTEIDRIAFKHCMDRNLCEYHPVIVVGDFNSTPDSSVIEFIKTGQLMYETLNKRTLEKDNITSPTGKVLIPPFLKITDYCQHSDTELIHDNTLSRGEQIVKLPLYHSEYKKEQHYLPEDSNNAKQYATGTLSHKFCFQSVYNHGTYENPEGTTNQGQWITTDYIFFNRSSGIRGKDWKLNLISKYTLPTLQDLRDIAIPNYELGSDHLSLVAKFSLKTPRK